MIQKVSNPEKENSESIGTSYVSAKMGNSECITIESRRVNLMLNKFARQKILREIYYHSLKLSRALIKLPTPYGWMTTYLYSGGISYVFGRPSESSILRFFKPKTGWTVVDAGAHIGWYTLIASKKVGSKGKVLAIEPEPRNFSILCKNIRDNKLMNVIPLRIALSDKDGYERLAMSPSPAMHSIMPNSNYAILVKARKMDSLLKELDIKQIDLFKMDVEDAEFKVLKGSKNILKNGTRLIIESGRPIVTQEYLRPLGYKTKRIDKANLFAYKNSKIT